jgi:tetraacyldisaccharide 4'-kinase
MGDTSTYMEIISGRRRGLLAASARGAFRALSWPYRALIAARNAYYSIIVNPVWLGIPVVSVGNLTVGGTGKTPACVWLCQRLLARGLKPAVLSRGYKASEEGLADELLMVSRQCPQAVMVAHPDRFKAGQMAIERYGAQAAILDDGFQHRRVGRDLDLLLVDATRPFGYGHILPRGLLREPVGGMLRADAVILTRCDQAEDMQVAALEAEIRRLHPGVPMVRAVHQAKGFRSLDGSMAVTPVGRRTGCFAGIARPDAFERTLVAVGVVPVERRWWPDHHRYTSADVSAIQRWAERSRLDALVTTEKDAVKLAALKADWPVPVSALHIEMEMLDDGEAVLSGMIDGMLKEWSDSREQGEDDGGQANEDDSRS